MAINILTEPTDPPVSGDFTRDQAIQHSNEVPNLSILNLWGSTASAPSAKQGAYIRHAGNTFQVQGSDETISGSPAAGVNYIIATESAGVITLAWATSLTGYAYNPAYGGIYNGSVAQVLRDVCFLDGTSYVRGFSNGHDFSQITYAGRSFLPVGFVYTQYPGKGSPLTLGLPGTWTNISSDFAGNFFRAEGGNASAFESGTQSDQNKAHTHTIDYVDDNTSGAEDHPSILDNRAYLAGSTGSSGGAEARPVNETVRIWERTA